MKEGDGGKDPEKKVVGGKYTVYTTKELGRGAFAITYAAKSKLDGNIRLACKVMNKSELQGVVSDVNYLMKRVREEVKNWKGLEHPHIVRFQGCQETKNNIYFFLQRCDQGTLEEYIQKNKVHIDFQQVFIYAKQLVHATAYLEEKGVLHRDIKPANILIKNKEIKLGDFGFARAINPDEDKSFYTFAGTLHFMAPEVLREEKQSYKCDVWSVGVTFFLMFTNQLPFNLKSKDNSSAKILQKITTEPLNLNAPFFEKYPQIGEILKKMLQLNPQFRLRMSEVHKMFTQL